MELAMGYLRNMRTTAECRAESGSEEQGVKVRAKRNRNNVPNAWDDIPHARRHKCDRHKDHRR
jgi:hypothetical protein